jgi:hypothetical protein
VLLLPQAVAVLLLPQVVAMLLLPQVVAMLLLPQVVTVLLLPQVVAVLLLPQVVAVLPRLPRLPNSVGVVVNKPMPLGIAKWSPFCSNSGARFWHKGEVEWIFTFIVTTN